MKFWVHVVVQIIVFVIISQMVDWLSAVVIGLFHFIPSLDYVMKKVKFYPELHRRLFHNIFIVLLASGIGYYLMDQKIAMLASLNLVLHIVMDLKGKGVAIVYPFSDYKVKLF